jgi:hypothetical protein
MLAKFWDIFFGCWHPHYSFPITVRSGPRSNAASLTGTYVVCLDCGKEFPYDWTEMKVISSPQSNQEPLNAWATRHAA